MLKVSMFVVSVLVIIASSLALAAPADVIDVAKSQLGVSHSAKMKKVKQISQAKVAFVERKMKCDALPRDFNEDKSQGYDRKRSGGDSYNSKVVSSGTSPSNPGGVYHVTYHLPDSPRKVAPEAKSCTKFTFYEYSRIGSSAGCAESSEPALPGEVSE